MISKYLTTVVLLYATSLCFGNMNKSIETSDLDSLQEARIYSIHNAIDNELDNFKDSTQFELGITADSKSVYLGRAFGNKGILFNPSFSYFHKSGFGIDVSENLAQRSKISAGVSNIDLSYLHSINDWWDFELDYGYWFIDKNFPSNLTLNNMLDCSNTFYVTDWFTATTDVSYMFGTQKGLLVQENISHAFYVYPSSKHQRISIEPEAGTYFGNASVYQKRSIATNDLINNIFTLLDLYGSLTCKYQVKTYVFGMSYEEDLAQEGTTTNKKGKTVKKKTTPIGYFSVSFKKYFSL